MGVKKKLALLALVMAPLYGCVALVAGGAGAAGAYMWTHGNLTRNYHQPMETTWEGALHALSVLNLPVIEQEHDKFNGRIKAKMAVKNDQLIIIMERWTDNETKVTVRAGPLGNRGISERVHEEIARALK
ncbi:MAG: DUF3568 family protein [Nitrospinae bacterium]|nr:DUF3568 family protein [Nitrospinota bacterium]